MYKDTSDLLTFTHLTVREEYSLVLTQDDFVAVTDTGWIEKDGIVLKNWDIINGIEIRQIIERKMDLNLDLNIK